MVDAGVALEALHLYLSVIMLKFGATVAPVERARVPMRALVRIGRLLARPAA